jgi:hypothetical protein
MHAHSYQSLWAPNFVGLEVRVKDRSAVECD